MVKPIGLLLVVLLMGGLVSLITGCSPIYVMRAAYEEGKILWRREPIADYLKRSDLQRDTQDKLQLVLAVRDFAWDVLKLNVGGSYSSYSYVDRPDLTYIVIAAPKTEMRPYTWWFLIVGDVPYKGFFSKADAEEEARHLDQEGYDTHIRTSAAFSTLGWFDDPLLAHLLKYERVALSNIVFHELFHNTLYVPGAGAFNESAANFIGHRAAIEFFRRNTGETSAEFQRAVQLWEEEREFARYVEEVVATLNELYGRDIKREDKLRLREEVFARSKAEWARRIADRPSHRFRGFSREPINNAILMHYVVYLNDLDLFEALFESTGKDLLRTIDRLRDAANAGGDPFDAVRASMQPTAKAKAVAS